MSGELLDEMRAGEPVTVLVGAVAELRAGAVEVIDPTPAGSSRQAFWTDPSGNLIELRQVG